MRPSSTWQKFLTLVACYLAGSLVRVLLGLAAVAVGLLVAVVTDLSWLAAAVITFLLVSFLVATIDLLDEWLPVRCPQCLCRVKTRRPMRCTECGGPAQRADQKATRASAG